MPRYLERYLAGEHVQVWDELQALGERVREEPLLGDAFAVASETMRRVRHNLKLLIPRLEARGYQFYADPTEYTPNRFGRYTIPPRLAVPHEETRAHLETVERALGELPISLRAFYEVVGAVNLVGEPPVPESEDAAWLDLVDSDWYDGGWRAGAVMDPLFVYGIASQYDDIVTGRREKDEDAGGTVMVLYPDSLVKYDISGFVPVGIALPCPAMDVPLQFIGSHPVPGPGHRVPFHFVEYLRLTLRRGGFSGYGMPDLETLPIDDDLCRMLTEGFLPF